MLDRLAKPSPAMIALACFVGALLGPATATASEKVRLDSGVPTMRTSMNVVAVASRGPYLEADLTVDATPLQAYVEPTDTCRQLFTPEATVKYVDNGPMGEYVRDALRCQQYGVGNLELWRDRGTRANAGGVPRAQANFRILYRDADRILLRGQFPLATALGFTGADDIVAVLDPEPECESAILEGVATMEYRGSGKRALSLVGRSGLCKIRGLIQPLPQGMPAVPRAVED